MDMSATYGLPQWLRSRSSTPAGGSPWPSPLMLSSGGVSRHCRYSRRPPRRSGLEMRWAMAAADVAAVGAVLGSPGDGGGGGSDGAAGGCSGGAPSA